MNFDYGRHYDLENKFLRYIAQFLLIQNDASDEMFHLINDPCSKVCRIIYNRGPKPYQLWCVFMCSAFFLAFRKTYSKLKYFKLKTYQWQVWDHVNCILYDRPQRRSHHSDEILHQIQHFESAETRHYTVKSKSINRIDLKNCMQNIVNKDHMNAFWTDYIHFKMLIYFWFEHFQLHI